MSQPLWPNPPMPDQRAETGTSPTLAGDDPFLEWVWRDRILRLGPAPIPEFTAGQSLPFDGMTSQGVSGDAFTSASFPLGIFARKEFPTCEAIMQTLSNGMTLIVDTPAGNEVAAVVILLPAGASSELDVENGLTNLTMRMLTHGTRSLTARQFNEKIESLGASFSAGATEDYAFISLTCLRQDLDTMLELAHDAFYHPAFEQEEMDKEREVIIAGLKRIEDDSFQFTYQEFLKDIYYGHPYGMNPRGTPECLAMFAPLNLSSRHEEVCRTGGAIVSIAGDVDSAMLAHLFEKWAPPVRPVAPRMVAWKALTTRGRPTRTLLKERNQGFVVMGYPAAPMKDEDMPYLRVVSAALGEGMSSRLFTILRDQGSLAYAVGTMCVPRFDQGYFACYIGTSPENIPAAVAGIQHQIELVTEDILPPKELERAQNYILGKFQLGLQTNEARARYRALSLMGGLGLDYMERYPDIIRHISAEKTRAIARRYLKSPVIVILKPKEAGE
ncbi:MAG: pitrilysin family protein [Candidatus Sumerlaeota bacterium]|nr:pitrilysin family protein [Candidatus Sumerlaeota bacterium]